MPLPLQLPLPGFLFALAPASACPQQATPVPPPAALSQEPSAPPPQQPPQQPKPRTGRATRADEAPAALPGATPEQTAVGVLGDAPVTGELLSGRAWLWQRGLAATVSSLTDASVVMAGGGDPGATALRTLVDAELDVDGERLCGLTGTRLYLDAQLQRGRDGSQDTGDFQVYSNIDGPDRLQLAQLFVEQVFADGAVRLKLGKSDANTDFAYVEHGLRFVQSSFGFSPTVLGFPTYPDPAFGGAAFAEPGLGTYVGAGVYDGATQAGIATGPHGPGTLFGRPGDLFAVVETGVAWQRDGPLPGRLGVGAWRHTGTFARADGGTEPGTAGGYATFDQQLWRPTERPGERRGVGAFLQYGHADPDVSEVAHYVGAGATWIGPFAQRADDACGIGVAWAIWRDRPDDELRGGGELAVECFYGVRVTPWLRLKPDVQYIHDPGGRPGVADAWVFTLRVAVEF